MNRIAFSLTEDGSTLRVNKPVGETLFGVETTDKYTTFKDSLINELKSNSRLSNEQIIDFTIREEFLPKHVKKVLEELSETNSIVVFDENGEVIAKKMQWNIAEKITKLVYFSWKGTK
jgi:hypothetical protein